DRNSNVHRRTGKGGPPERNQPGETRFLPVLATFHDCPPRRIPPRNARRHDFGATLSAQGGICEMGLACWPEHCASRPHRRAELELIEMRSGGPFVTLPRTAARTAPWG